jgi:hypothetical protein
MAEEEGEAMRFVIAVVATAATFWIVPVVLAFTVGRLFDDLTRWRSFIPVAGELFAGAVAGAWVFLRIGPSVR